LTFNPHEKYAFPPKLAENEIETWFSVIYNTSPITMFPPLSTTDTDGKNPILCVIVHVAAETL
jgi:hypothetical protein